MASRQIRLHLFRHPPPLVAPGICYGQTDLPVMPQAAQQLAQQIGRQFPSALPVYSSPLQRCLDVAKLCHAVPRSDARLMEMHFGTWEMQSWDQIPIADTGDWANDLSQYRPGGGESLLMLIARLRSFLTDLQKEQSDEVIVVCHGGVIRVFSQWISGGSDLQIAQRMEREWQTLPTVPYGAYSFAGIDVGMDHAS